MNKELEKNFCEFKQKLSFQGNTEVVFYQWEIFYLKYFSSFLSYLACLKEGSFFKHYLNFYMKNTNLKKNIQLGKCQNETFWHF